MNLLNILSWCFHCTILNKNKYLKFMAESKIVQHQSAKKTFTVSVPYV